MRLWLCLLRLVVARLGIPLALIEGIKSGPSLAQYAYRVASALFSEPAQSQAGTGEAQREYRGFIRDTGHANLTFVQAHDRAHDVQAHPSTTIST